MSDSFSISSGETSWESERSNVTLKDLKDFQKESTENLAQLHSESILEGHEVVQTSSFKDTYPQHFSDLSSFSLGSESSRMAIARVSSSSTGTKEEIKNRGMLFSSGDFKAMAGPARFWHGANYRAVVHALEDYERAESSLSINQRINLLQDLKKKTEIYFTKKQKESEKNPNFSALKDRVKAGEFLLQGIKNELKEWTEVKDEMTFNEAKKQFGTGEIVNLQTKNIKECSLLSGGGVHESVKKITLEDGSTVVFKEELNNPSNLIEGIPENTLACRAVTFSCLNRLLGWDIVPSTKYAVHDNKIGYCQDFANGESLYKTEFIPTESKEIQDSNSPYYQMFQIFINGDGSGLGGEPEFNISCKPPFLKEEDGIYENGKRIEFEEALQLLEKGDITFYKKTIRLSEVDFSNPHLQKSLSKAHCLYVLGGAGDPQLMNIIFKKMSNGDWEAALIDNDFSFVEGFGAFNNPKGSRIEKIRNRKGMPIDILPQLIDSKSAEDIDQLTPELVAREMKNNKLPQKTIEEAQERLRLLKEHIAKARKNGTSGTPRLVEVWNEETFQKLNTPFSKEEESTLNCQYDNYVGLGFKLKRELEEKLQLQAR